jgi:hypothetical protein
MQEAGHLLSGRDFQRVGDAVRRVEGEYNAGSQSGEARGGNSVQVLQIQSGASNSFGYPARIQKWSNSAGTWSDLSAVAVRVADPNGGILTEDQYVLARFLGINTSNVGCFAMDGPFADDCAPGCGWVAGLIDADCLAGSIPSATGRCVTDTDDAWTSTFEWSTDHWLAADTLEISGTAYTVKFFLNSTTSHDPQLTLTEGMNVHYAVLDCCGDNYAVFAIGSICTGDTLCPPTAPGSNIVRIKVEYAVCPNPLYGGEGWYCVADTAGEAASEGPNLPDTGSADAPGMGEVGWVNAGNLTATDATDATATFVAAANTAGLRATDYDFTTITYAPTSLTVTIKKKANTATSIVDHTVQLIVNGTAAGANKADTVTTWGTGYAETTYTWTESELVTAGLTAAYIAQTNFGVLFKITNTVAAARVASVDSITVSAEDAGPCSDTTVEYLDADPGICAETDTGYFQMCEGPFATEAAATAVCSFADEPGDLDPATALCGEVPVPATLFVSASNQTGGCLDEPWAVTRTDDDVFQIAGNGCEATITCNGTNYDVTGMGATGCFCTNPTYLEIVYFSESPWIMIIDLVHPGTIGSPTCPCGTTGGTARFTVTGV